MLRTRAERRRRRSAEAEIGEAQEPQSLVITTGLNAGGAEPQPIQTFERSRALEFYSQFQLTPWQRLSADRLNLPGARIALEYFATHSWHPRGETLTGDSSVLECHERDCWPAIETTASR